VQACTHADSNVEANITKPLNEVTIEYVDKESDDDFKHLILNPAYYNIGMLPDKGKGIFINEEIVVDVKK